MERVSDIGVLDKAMVVLDALARRGSLDLNGLVQETGLTRPTAYRLAVALEAHRVVARDERRRFILGLRLLELGGAAASRLDLRRLARPLMEELAEETGESVQLFVPEGEFRVCIEAVESGRSLRDIVPVGARLPLTAGSGAKVLRAWPGSAGDGLEEVRRRGWAESVAEREPGVASVSAPVFDTTGRVVASLSVSGPIERTSRRPGRIYAGAVVSAADRIGTALQGRAAVS